MSELYARTVAELSEELRTGRVSSVELTRLFLARSEQHQGERNSQHQQHAHCGRRARGPAVESDYSGISGLSCRGAALP